MSKKKRVRVIIAAVLCLSQSVSPASASWMNDWIGAKSTTGAGPSYLDGQARGYLSGGSYSARWPVSQNNNLISSTLPKLSAGCGGIDFYGGSLSFLKPDMLVKKLQNVMQNSAGVAFQMALDTLSPKIASIVSNMEDISNKLNAMSMDDCTAAKGLVTGVRSAAEDIAEGYRMGELGTGISEGLSDSYSAIKSAVPAVSTLADINNWTNTQKGKPPGTVAGLAGCPADLQKLFPSSDSQYPVSVLKVVGNQMSLPSGHIDLLRGLVGDIQINSITNSSRPVNYVPPCSNNAKVEIKDISNASIEAKTEAGACSVLPATDTNLQKYVDGKMQAVMGSLLTKSALSATDVSFVTSMPTPVLYGMRVAVMTGQQASLTPMLVESAAAGLSMSTMRDLLARYEEILAYMNGVGRLTDSAADCRLGTFSKDLEAHVKEARANIVAVHSVVGNSYAQHLQEITSSFALNNQLKDLDKKLKENVARSFGASVAQRAMRSI